MGATKIHISAGLISANFVVFRILFECGMGRGPPFSLKKKIKKLKMCLAYYWITEVNTVLFYSLC